MTNDDQWWPMSICMYSDCCKHNCSPPVNSGAEHGREPIFLMHAVDSAVFDMAPVCHRRSPGGPDIWTQGSIFTKQLIQNLPGSLSAPLWVIATGKPFMVIVQYEWYCLVMIGVWFWISTPTSFLKHNQTILTASKKDRIPEQSCIEAGSQEDSLSATQALYSFEDSPHGCIPLMDGWTEGSMDGWCSKKSFQ